jgi:hypothetical protein
LPYPPHPRAALVTCHANRVAGLSRFARKAREVREAGDFYMISIGFSLTHASRTARRGCVRCVRCAQAGVTRARSCRVRGAARLASPVRHSQPSAALARVASNAIVTVRPLATGSSGKARAKSARPLSPNTPPRSLLWLGVSLTANLIFHSRLRRRVACDTG